MLKSQQNVASRDGHPDTIAHPKGTEPGTNPDPRQEDLNTNPAWLLGDFIEKTFGA